MFQHGALAVHVLQSGSKVLTSLFHHTKLDAPADLQSRFYFARLAWTVLYYVNSFLVTGCLVKQRTNSFTLEVRHWTRTRRLEEDEEGSIGSAPVTDWLESVVCEGDDPEVDGDGFNDEGDPSSERAGPPDEAAEMAHDLTFRDRFFPEMAQEVEWAPTATYHNINWYPGGHAVERRKEKWREAIAGGKPICTILSDLVSHLALPCRLPSLTEAVIPPHIQTLSQSASDKKAVPPVRIFSRRWHSRTH